MSSLLHKKDRIFSSGNLIEHKSQEGECLEMRLESSEMVKYKVPTKAAQLKKVFKWIWSLYYR